jgi:predicted kinase
MTENIFLEEIFEKYGNEYSETKLLKPVAIFMMGIPSAGKSTILKPFIKNILPLVLYDLDILNSQEYLIKRNFITCNPDILMSYMDEYEKSKEREYLTKATIQSNKLVKMILEKEKKYNFIYDATGSLYGHYIKHIENAKEQGYITILINVSIKLFRAIDRVSYRERRVSKEIINKLYKDIYDKKNDKSKYPNKNNLEILSEKVDISLVVDNNRTGEHFIKGIGNDKLNKDVYLDMIF